MKSTSGFTLVELAIALMVIGLLIGGVLKGQELIENVHVTRVTKDITDYDTAIIMFRDMYDNEIPGDMRDPQHYLPNCTGICSAALSHGTGNYKLDYFPEVQAFWIHLDRAGLIKGVNETSDYYQASPRNSFGGHMVMMQFSVVGDVPPGIPTEEHPYIHQFRVGDIAGGGAYSDTLGNCTRVQRIDEKMDDGIPLKGRVKLYINRYNSLDCYDTTTLKYVQNRARTYVLIASDGMN